METRSKRIWTIFKDAAKAYSDDKVSVLGAALSYYTLFSLAPLLIIAIAVAGFVFGESASRGQVFQALHGTMGEHGAQAVQTMIQSASRPGSGLVATIAGVAALFLGASGAFTQLQDSLNQIWGVKLRPDIGIKGVILHRALTFAAVLSSGLLLLGSILLNAVLGVVGKYVVGWLPGGETLWQWVNFIASFAVLSALFAMLFKVLPDVTIRWRDTFVGAGVTSLLFGLGKLAIGLYLGKSGVASAYGAASSLVLLLVWVYYSSQIFYFGAEFTKAYANRSGGEIRPKPHAVRIGASPSRAQERSAA